MIGIFKGIFKGILPRELMFFDNDSLIRFFFKALNKQTTLMEMGFVPTANSTINYYEFGVGWGGTLTDYIRALKLFCRFSNKDIRKYHIFGFDSFEGLPKKENEKDDHPEWFKGQFSHGLDYIEREIDKVGGRAQLFKGFFKDTLKPGLRKELSIHPPSIVTIDVDYYSSTKTVLDWLRPMLISGTIFYFDDLWCFHGDPKYGQFAAIKEFNKAGKGQLIEYPSLGMVGNVFIYANWNQLKKQLKANKEKEGGVDET